MCLVVVLLCTSQVAFGRTFTWLQVSILQTVHSEGFCEGIRRGNRVGREHGWPRAPPNI